MKTIIVMNLLNQEEDIIICLIMPHLILIILLETFAPKF